MTSKELVVLKEKLEAKRDEVTTLKGRREQLLLQLKEQYGCSSIIDAQKKLKKLTIKEKELEADLQKKVQLFEKKYAELLED